MLILQLSELLLQNVVKMSSFVSGNKVAKELTCAGVGTQNDSESLICNIVAKIAKPGDDAWMTPIVEFNRILRGEPVAFLHLVFIRDTVNNHPEITSLAGYEDSIERLNLLVDLAVYRNFYIGKMVNEFVKLHNKFVRTEKEGDFKRQKLEKDEFKPELSSYNYLINFVETEEMTRKFTSLPELIKCAEELGIDHSGYTTDAGMSVEDIWKFFCNWNNEKEADYRDVIKEAIEENHSLNNVYCELPEYTINRSFMIAKDIWECFNHEWNHNQATNVTGTGDSVIFVVEDDGSVYISMTCRVNGPGNGCFALAGGLRDNGESPEECSVRETEEETGINLKTVVQDIHKLAEHLGIDMSQVTLSGYELPSYSLGMKWDTRIKFAKCGTLSHGKGYLIRKSV